MAVFLAVAEQQIVAARGAQIADENIPWTYASIEKLRTVGSAQIEQHTFWRRLVPRRHHVEPLQRIRFIAGAQLIEEFRRIRELSQKRADNLRADLVATTADCRADGGKHIRGIGAKFHLHPANSLGNDTLQRTAPSSVHGRHRALFGVDEQNGNAIGSLHAKQEPAMSSDGSVATARLIRRGAEYAHHIGMKLAQRNQFESVSSELRLKAAAIFKHVFASVPFREAKIQHWLAIELAYAAAPGAESVNQPGKLQKFAHLQYTQCLRVVLKPGTR